MNSCGIKKANKVLVPLLLLMLTFCTVSSFAASGVLIFSSWDTQEKATKDAERITGILEQNATTMEATVNDRKVFRVVVAVATDEDRTTLKQTAEDKKLQSWFLSTEKISEVAETSDETDSAPTTGSAGASSTGDQKIVLSVSGSDPNEVLEFLDQATIDSTLAKLDAVRKRAQDLIPDFQPRSEEQPPIEDLPGISPIEEEPENPPLEEESQDTQTEQVEETEEQPETSSTE